MEPKRKPQGLVFSKFGSQELFDCMAADDGHEWTVVSPGSDDERSVREILQTQKPSIILINGFYEQGDAELYRQLGQKTVLELRTVLKDPQAKLPAGILLARLVQ